MDEFAFKRVKPNAFSNDYIMNDGNQGHEVATVATDNITIRARPGQGWEEAALCGGVGQGTLIRK